MAAFLLLSFFLLVKFFLFIRQMRIRIFLYICTYVLVRSCVSVGPSVISNL